MQTGRRRNAVRVKTKLWCGRNNTPASVLLRGARGDFTGLDLGRSCRGQLQSCRSDQLGKHTNEPRRDDDRVCVCVRVCESMTGSVCEVNMTQQTARDGCHDDGPGQMAPGRLSLPPSLSPFHTQQHAQVSRTRTWLTSCYRLLLWFCMTCCLTIEADVRRNLTRGQTRVKKH